MPRAARRYWIAMSCAGGEVGMLPPAGRPTLRILSAVMTPIPPPRPMVVVGLESARGLLSPYPAKRSGDVGCWCHDLRDRRRACVSCRGRKPPAGCGGRHAVFVGAGGADDDRHCVGRRGHADPTEIAEGGITMLGLPPPIPMPVLLGIFAVMFAAALWYRSRYGK